MLTLNDGRSELWQWDTGRTLAVDADCSQVHFSNKVFGRSLDVDVIDGVAAIPDILLQTDKELTAWAFVGTAENGYTKISKVFKVNKRNKPADYVFTPTDQTTLDDILDRIEDLEKRPSGGNGGITKEVDPTVPAWAKQPQKPTYTAAEVGALPDTYTPPAAPVQSVNGKTGDVNLTADEVGAIHVPDTATVGQTIVVKEVDEDGKPVSWECTDVAGGGSGGWRTIADITLEEPAAPIKIDTDMDGNSFSLKEVEIYFCGKTYTRETGVVSDKTSIRVCYNATVWSWATTAYNDEAKRTMQFVRSIFTGTEIISLGHGDSVLKQQVLNSKATSAKSIVISNSGSDGTIAFAEGTRVIVRGVDAK